MTHRIDGTLRIPAEDFLSKDGKSDTVLIKELLKLQATQHSKYLISVAAPEGFHDDLSDAYARSVYLASNFLANSGGIVKSNKDINNNLLINKTK